MDQPVSVARYAAHTSPVVARNGTNWLVVWAELFPEFEGDSVVYGTRVSHDGSVLDPTGIPTIKLISKCVLE